MLPRDMKFHVTLSARGTSIEEVLRKMDEEYMAAREKIASAPEGNGAFISSTNAAQGWQRMGPGGRA